MLKLPNIQKASHFAQTPISISLKNKNTYSKLWINGYFGSHIEFMQMSY